MGNKKRNIKTNLKAPDKLKILFVIINRKKMDYFVDFLQEYNSNLQLLMYAKGTAPSDIINYLGLEDNNRGIILSVVQEDKESEILEKLEDRFETNKKTKGIAFTISMTSIIGVMIYQFLANKKGE